MTAKGVSPVTLRNGHRRPLLTGLCLSRIPDLEGRYECSNCRSLLRLDRRVWVAGSHSLGKKRTAISTIKKTITLQPKKTIRINTYNPLSTLRIDWLLSMSMQPFVNLASVSLVGRELPVEIVCF